MITAVDTNILLDIFLNDQRYCRVSSDILRKCLQEGVVIACDIVWAETAAAFDSEKKFVEIMSLLSLKFSPMEEKSSFLAGQIWKEYRKSGTTKKNFVTDFIVGAHAKMQADRLLTRDRGFYRGYFKGLQIIDPEEKMGKF